VGYPGRVVTEEEDMAEVPELHGRVEPGFEPVQEAFIRNFRDHGEVGASCAVTLDGRPVVDLWAGWADRGRTRPWNEDTLVNVYSTTKGMTALAAHILADRGQLDFEAPVVEYWPEFGQAGKAEMPVRYLLTHQAGLPVIDEELPENASLDWHRMVAALERQAPVWKPGEKQGYHAVTFGWLVGEVVRRVSGAATFGDFLKDALCRPLGLDLYVGTPASEHHRVADLVRDVAVPAAVQAEAEGSPDAPEAAAMRERMRLMFAPDSLTARCLSLASPPFAPSNNDPRWRQAQVPAANGHTNARALARLYGALARGGEVDGTRLLSAQSVKLAAAEQVKGPDACLIMDTRRSLGFMLPLAEQGDRRGPASFGHAGAGGSLGYADPERGIGFGYTMNKMWNMVSLASPDPRAQSLVAAVHSSLEATS
jgi:CubicO group peptidase (beta-lactamase class C family)